MFGFLADLSQSITIESCIFRCQVSYFFSQQADNGSPCVISHPLIFSELRRLQMTYDFYYGFRQYFVHMDDSIPQKVSYNFQLVQCYRCIGLIHYLFFPFLGRRGFAGPYLPRYALLS